MGDGRPNASAFAALIASVTSVSLLERVATWISLHPNNTASFRIASMTKLYFENPAVNKAYKFKTHSYILSDSNLFKICLTCFVSDLSQHDEEGAGLPDLDKHQWQELECRQQRQWQELGQEQLRHWQQLELQDDEERRNIDLHHEERRKLELRQEEEWRSLDTRHYDDLTSLISSSVSACGLLEQTHEAKSEELKKRHKQETEELKKRHKQETEELEERHPSMPSGEGMDRLMKRHARRRRQLEKQLEKQLEEKQRQGETANPGSAAVLYRTPM